MNTGGTGSYLVTNSSYGLVTHWYGYERETLGNIPTEWKSSNTARASKETTKEKVIDSSLFRSIALPYPSDFGYATSGGTLGRDGSKGCFSKVLYNNTSYRTDCAGTAWLKPASGDMWTLSPDSSNFINAYVITSSGNLFSLAAFQSESVYPTLYLSSSVKISGGNGKSGSPYQLVLN